MATFYDGLFWALDTWLPHTKHVLHKFGIEGKWQRKAATVIQGIAIKQNDKVNCGPIACMVLWKLLRPESANEITDYRNATIDELTRLIHMHDGMLVVLRRKKKTTESDNESDANTVETINSKKVQLDDPPKSSDSRTETKKKTETVDTSVVTKKKSRPSPRKRSTTPRKSKSQTSPRKRKTSIAGATNDTSPPEKERSGFVDSDSDTKETPPATKPKKRMIVESPNSDEELPTTPPKPKPMKNVSEDEREWDGLTEDSIHQKPSITTEMENELPDKPIPTCKISENDQPMDNENQCLPAFAETSAIETKRKPQALDTNKPKNHESRFH